jgi:hypothetical protein
MSNAAVTHQKMQMRNNFRYDWLASEMDDRDETQQVV